MEKKRLIKNEVLDDREEIRYAVTYLHKCIDAKTYKEGWKKVFTQAGSVRDYHFDDATLYDSFEYANGFADWLRKEMSVEGRGWRKKTIESIKVETVLIKRQTTKTYTIIYK